MVAEGESFDCRKICVTKTIQDEFFAYYQAECKADQTSIAMLLCMSGPKTNVPEEDDNKYIGYFYIIYKPQKKYQMGPHQP